MADADRDAPGMDEAVEAAEATAHEFIQWARGHHDALVGSVIHALADQDCDLANGDTYDDAEYRDTATAAVGAVVEMLAWSDRPAAAAVRAEVRAKVLAEVEAALIAERDKITADQWIGAAWMDVALDAVRALGEAPDA